MKYYDFSNSEFKYLQGNIIAPPWAYNTELREALPEDRAAEKLRLLKYLEHMSRFPTHYPETIESIKGTLKMLDELETH